ncbi:MAG: hypothetical protein KBA46_04720 [Candidatus Omnitrophica bacterium]|nr:hypothetical protein [Candidatus Omnitrophota bacterium]
MRKFHLFVQAKCIPPLQVTNSNESAVGYFQNFYGTFEDEEEAVVAAKKIIESDNAELVTIEVKDCKIDPKTMKNLLSDPEKSGFWAKLGRVYFPAKGDIK